MMSFSRKGVISALLATTLCAAGAWAQAGAREDRWQADPWQQRDGQTWDDREAQFRGHRDARMMPGGQQQRGAMREMMYTPQLERATELISTDVVDVNGHRVGRIDDLAIDTEHGVVAYAVIDRRRGRDRDEGERRVAVPFSVLRAGLGRDEVLLETDGRLLTRLRAIDDDDYARLNDPRWARDVHQLFAVQPYWVAPGRAARTGMMQDQDVITEDIYGFQDQDQQWDADWSERQMDPRQQHRGQHEQQFGQREGDWRQGDHDFRDRESYRPQGGASMWERERQGELERGRIERGTPIQPRMRSAGPDRPGRIVRADKILDKRVRGTGDERIGSVDDLMVDMNTGGVTYAIVSSRRDNLHAVPWNLMSLRGPADDLTLSLAMRGRDLSNAPSFDSDSWPNMDSPYWTRSVHAYFGVEPAWSHYGFMDADSRMD